MDGVLAYLSGWTIVPLICLIVGIVLLIAEMFTPGFGVMGGLGMLALAAAVVFRSDSLESALITVLLMLLIIGLFAVIFYRSFKSGKLSRSFLVQNESIKSEATSLSAPEMKEYIGREGICLTALRPSGNVAFGETRMDCSSEGDFIEKGAKVIVTQIDGLRVIVRKA